MESARCKAFLAAAEEGTFLGAAERLGYTASGVGQLVKSLEDELSLQLFVRSRSGVRLTDSGERLLPAVRSFLAQEEEIYHIAHDITDLVTGKVTIQSFSSIASQWIPDLFQAFRERYPGIELDLWEGVSPTIRENLGERRIDLAFFDRESAAGFDWFPLLETPLSAILPKGHPMAGKKRFPLRRLAEENVIVSQRSEELPWTEFLDAEGLNIPLQYMVLAPLAAIAMVKKGMGITVDSELFGNSWGEEVVAVPLWPLHKIELGIAIPSLKESSPAAKTLLRFALKFFGKDEERVI